MKQTEGDDFDYQQISNNCIACMEVIGGGKDCFQLETCSCVVHVSCIKDHIDVRLQQGSLQIKCLNSAVDKKETECQRDLLPRDLYALMTQRQLKRFFQLSISLAVDDSKGEFLWCNTPDCNQLYWLKPGAQYYKCTKCLIKYCLECQVQFHENMTCL